MEVDLANRNPFVVDVKMATAIFYSPHVESIRLLENYKEGFMESCDITSQGFRIKIQSTEVDT